MVGEFGWRKSENLLAIAMLLSKVSNMVCLVVI